MFIYFIWPTIVAYERVCVRFFFVFNSTQNIDGRFARSSIYNG